MHEDVSTPNEIGTAVLQRKGFGGTKLEVDTAAQLRVSLGDACQPLVCELDVSSDRVNARDGEVKALGQL